jgi:glucuronate isomerase
MTFQDDNLLLGNDAAREIFKSIEDLPVYDMHTHVDLKMVNDNECAPDPWTALCKGDHYVASIIESLGAMDRDTFYNPDTPGIDKWNAYANIFPRLMGNQIRDWMKITLRELGVEKDFNVGNAQAIWDELSEKLATDRWRPVELFKNTNIKMMSTTDNPVDDLAQIKRSGEAFGEGYWMPAWRPDPFFNLTPGLIVTKTWSDWMDDLEKVTGHDVRSTLKVFKDALAERHQYFADNGCRVSDYGVTVPYGHDVSDSRASEIFGKAARGQAVEADEAADFQSYMTRFSMGLDYEEGWVSQIHYGAKRNQRNLAKELGGLDSGCDTIGGDAGVVEHLHDLLNHFDSGGSQQHKILLYSLDKRDWMLIAGLSRIFPSVYAGVSWWYFDSVSGMLEFMRTVPDAGAGLAKTGPFVTDARNIYSLVPRSQVYRRCLSTVLGEAVEFRGDSIDDAKSLAAYMAGQNVTEMLGR